MQKAIFLDRDGVINSDVGRYYIYKPDDFVLNDGILSALQKLKKAGFIFFVITNQGGIAKGLYSKKDVNLVHAKLTRQFLEAGIELKAIYTCPHHPDFENCLCRKPGALMFEKAIARFAIDKTKSYMIGDSVKDMEAAKNAGIQGIKIASNQNIQTILSVILSDSDV